MQLLVKNLVALKDEIIQQGNYSLSRRICEATKAVFFTENRPQNAAENEKNSKVPILSLLCRFRQIFEKFRS